MERDILDRLRKWASYRTGDIVGDGGNWGEALTADLNDAIAEIERLRRLAGAVTDGDDFATIRRDLRTR